MTSRWSLRRKARECVAEQLTKIRKEIEDERNESLHTASDEAGPSCSSVQLGASQRQNQYVSCQSTENSSSENIHNHNEIVTLSSSESEIIGPCMEYNENAFEVEYETQGIQTF